MEPWGIFIAAVTLMGMLALMTSKFSQDDPSIKGTLRDNTTKVHDDLAVGTDVSRKAG